MTRMLTVCKECGHEHYFEDFSPTNCHNCNSPLTGNIYPVPLLDQVVEVVEIVDVIVKKYNCSFNQAVDCLFKSLKKPEISSNLLNDSNIWEILQPPNS